MKKIILGISVIILTSMTTAQAQNYQCIPVNKEGHFTDMVSLEILDASSIKVNDVLLNIDSTYKSKKSTDFHRFSGETSDATRWTDTGTVEVFYSLKKNILEFRIRGESFINEYFSCNE